MKLKYAITGSSGFLGKALIKELGEKNLEETLFFFRKLASLQRKAPYLSWDIDSIEMLPENLEVDVLFHLAWQGVENTFKNDVIQLANIELTKKICIIAKKLKVKNIVALGSQAEYGIKNRIIKETESTEPVTLYGKEKLRCYAVLKDFCECNAINLQWMRLFSAYGPNDNSCWLIPSVIEKFLKGEKPLLTKGEQFWDYIYVDDAARALIEVAKNKNSSIYNLASGRSTKVQEIVFFLHRIINPNVPCEFGSIPYQKDQIFHLQADITKLLNSTRWSPQVSIKEGLLKTITFFREKNNSIPSLAFSGFD